jgi:hypothetical protein
VEHLKHLTRRVYRSDERDDNDDESIPHSPKRILFQADKVITTDHPTQEHQELLLYVVYAKGS